MRKLGLPLTQWPSREQPKLTCRAHSRKEVRRVMHSAEPFSWYEHEAWGGRPGRARGRGSTFVTHSYPYPASFPQQLSIGSSPQMHTGRSWLPGWTQAFCTAGVFRRQHLEAGSGNSSSRHPPSPLLSQWLQEVWQKEGCLLRSFLLPGAGLCQVGV